MQRVLTAMGSCELNKRLKEIKDFNVYEKDVQYKEGIIDILKIDKFFDVIIIYENLDGEIDIRNLIKKIKLINSDINIIFILDEKNENMEKVLFNENIKNIFYNSEINLNDFINKIKQLNLSQEEILKKEINNLKKIITEKDKELFKFKNYNEDEEYIEKIKKENIISKKRFNNKINNYKKSKITIISELNKSILKNIFNSKKYYFYNYFNLNNKIKYSEKIIFIIKNDLDDLKKYIDKINLIKNKYSINLEKMNIIFLEDSRNLINYRILKSVFKDYKVIGKIKYKNDKYKFIKKKLLKFTV